MEQLGNHNFIIYAMRNYDTPACSDLEEFNNELKRFGYITRSFKLGNINTQLVLNHIIILYNVFGEATTNMLLFKVEKEYWNHLIPFLIYLDRLSHEKLSDLIDGISLDQNIIEDLRKL